MSSVSELNALSLVVALGAGLLSFISPCVLPLVPVYIGYITGTSAADARTTAQSSRFAALAPTIAFICGLAVVFMLLGATATADRASTRPIPTADHTCRRARGDRFRVEHGRGRQDSLALPHCAGRRARRSKPRFTRSGAHGRDVRRGLGTLRRAISGQHSGSSKSGAHCRTRNGAALHLRDRPGIAISACGICLGPRPARNQANSTLAGSHRDPQRHPFSHPGVPAGNRSILISCRTSHRAIRHWSGSVITIAKPNSVA